MRWLLAWALVGGWALPAYAAEPRVLVLEPSAAPSGLLIALQIQLSGLALPEQRTMGPLSSTAESIERASQLVRAESALAAVWVERGTRAGPVVVYVVGEREGRALIEVVHVPGDRRPDLERTIALKVRELVAAMRRGQAAQPEAAQLLQAEEPPAAQPSAALPGEQAEETSQTAPSWAVLAFAGARLGSQPDFGLGRWGFGVGAGPVLHLQRIRLAIALGFDAFPSIGVERAGNRARFWEWAASAALHAQLRAGPFWLGARVGPQLVGLNAYGITREGNDGTATPTSWALSLGLDAEVPIARSVSLLAGLQLQALASRLHLDVNDAEIIDLGRVRARIGLDLVARF